MMILFYLLAGLTALAIGCFALLIAAFFIALLVNGLLGIVRAMQERWA